MNRRIELANLAKKFSPYIVTDRVFMLAVENIQLFSHCIADGTFTIIIAEQKEI